MNRRLAVHQPGRPAAVSLLACLSFVAVLGGCSGSLLPKPPSAPARYTLDRAAAPAVAAPNGRAASQPARGASAPALVVGVPRAAAGFDSTRIVYLRQPQELEAFAFHEWVAAPAQMLAPLIVRALQEGGGFGVVLLAPSSGSGALRLETDLIRLQHDFTSRPSQVRLTLRAVLVDSATRQVLGWREFDESVSAASDDPPGGVAAAHLATQRVLVALASFCAEQVLGR